MADTPTSTSHEDEALQQVLNESRSEDLSLPVDEEAEEDNKIRELIRGRLAIVPSEAIDDIEEPIVHLKTTLAFTNASDNRDILATVEISYLPDEIYLREQTLEDYFKEFYSLEFLPESVIKLTYSDLYEVLQPQSLEIAMEYITDRGISVTLGLPSSDLPVSANDVSSVFSDLDDDGDSDEDNNNSDEEEEEEIILDPENLDI